MPVEPVIQQYLDQLNALTLPPIDQVTPEQMRKSQELQVSETGEEVAQVENRLISLEDRNIPIRIYTPNGQGPFPTLVFYHGGGWVFGSLNTHDSICRFFTNYASCMVISVDYRLAPEHKFPAAVWDAYDSLHWVASHTKELNIDVERIAVGGDSAGGNLAAVACLIAKERKSPSLCYQLLIYPSTGYEEIPQSMIENGQGYLLTTDFMRWFRDHYYRTEQDQYNPYASPILAKSLAGLPKALVVTAQFDPLRDVGKAYAERLRSFGVDVQYRNYDTLIHGFANMYTFVPKAREALIYCSEQLKQAFYS